MAICKVPDCGRKHKAHGYCSKHYDRFRINGTLETKRGKNGTGHLRQDGYVTRHIGGIRQLEHQIVGERALGKPLPENAVIHHWDKNRSNNTPANLAVFPNRQYHNLIHQRMRAYDVCGHADWLKCRFCKQYDDPKNMAISKSGHGYHRECDNSYQRQSRIERNAKESGAVRFS
jgi:hypothetical protein